MKTKAENKQLNLRDTYIQQTGLVLSDMNYMSLSKRDKLIVCLVKAVLIFSVTMGLNLLVITSFELPCSIVVITAFAALLSFALSLLYIRRLYFNIGYIGLLLLFIGMAYALLRYANSGMNAIVNIIMEAVDRKLNLGGVRVYQELYTNRFVSITSCLLLIMFLEVCFLNSLISEYMSGCGVFLVIYPLFQLCIYLDDTVNYFCLAMIFIPIVCCMILKRSRRFRLSLNKQELGYHFTKNKIAFNGRSFKKTNVIMSVFSGIVAAVVLILSILFAKAMPFSLRSGHSAWKDMTDQDVAEFAMNGFSGYFNSYYATGGISGGKLGGVREVTLDFQTDLIVRYVPYANESLYLKAFVAGTYNKNQWIRVKDFDGLFRQPYYFSPESDRLVNIESNYLLSLLNSGVGDTATAQMTITNIDADRKYYYYPYYTNLNSAEISMRGGEPRSITGDMVTGKMPSSNRYTLTFQPLLNKTLAYQANIREDDTELYRDFVYNHYLDVPSNLQNLLNTICVEQNFHGNTMEIVNQIRTYFFKNYTYTLSPGKTPANRDFITYFLTRQKKGYCAHFASAGAMLLRQMGIPTRYVEGYCVDMGTVADSDAVIDEDWEDWYEGDYILDSKGNQIYVVEVEVNDSKAHCWVEVYIDGFGWMPVELTTGRQENTAENADFWANFRNLFGNDEDNSSPLQNLTNQLRGLGNGIMIVIAIAAGILVIILLVLRFISSYRIYYLNNNRRLINQYVLLNKLLNRYQLTEAGNVYHKKAAEIAISYGINEQLSYDYIHAVEKASFSNEKLTCESLNQATTVFRMYLKEIRRRVPFLSKIKLLIKY